MTQIAISDDVTAHLAAAAADRGCTQEDLASVLLEDGLRRDDNFVLTSDEESRLLQSIRQAERGELVNGDSVMGSFGNALREIELK